jgi:hypothetical protein
MQLGEKRYCPKVHRIVLLAFCIALTLSAGAQQATNSTLVNFGRFHCDSSIFTGSDLTLVANDGTNYDLFLQCELSGLFSNAISKYVSYNGINNKLYINDISDYTNSNIYILDIGLPANVTCADLDTPDYLIENIILSQFEFDPTGDLYAISNYDGYTGIAEIGAYDDTTGLLESGSLKTLYFPLDELPTDLSNGDIMIVPNGRMFCVFGWDVSRLFEITNYSKTETGDAVATFLGSPTKVCYGLAFQNGNLIMGGTDLYGGCYSFTYDLANETLSDEFVAPLNIMPIDHTSFSASVAAGMKLNSAVQIDATHFDLTYLVYIENLGNVTVGGIQIEDDLTSVFGEGNISNVSLSFIYNGAELELNPAFNGGSNTRLLKTTLPAQELPNFPDTAAYSIIQISLRVADPIPDHTYWNSAQFTGKIGRDSTLITLIDSSNNYVPSFTSWNEAVDPNINNVADDPDEGLLTPWEMNMILPIQLAEFTVAPQAGGAMLDWITSSEEDNLHFIIERSADTKTFDSIGLKTGTGTSLLSRQYSFFDQQPPLQTMYYRLRQVNMDGSHSFSEIRVFKAPAEQNASNSQFALFPNPATNLVTLANRYATDEALEFEIQDVLGATVMSGKIPANSSRFELNVMALPPGHYFFLVKSPSVKASQLSMVIER